MAFDAPGSTAIIWQKLEDAETASIGGKRRMKKSMSFLLTVCLSVCLSVCVYVCLSACLPVCLSVCLSVCQLFVQCPSMEPSVNLPSVPPSVHLSFSCLYVHGKLDICCLYTMPACLSIMFKLFRGYLSGEYGIKAFR